MELAFSVRKYIFLFNKTVAALTGSPAACRQHLYYIKNTECRQERLGDNFAGFGSFNNYVNIYLQDVDTCT